VGEVLQELAVLGPREGLVASASEDESVRLWSFSMQLAEDEIGDPIAKFVVERPRTGGMSSTGLSESRSSAYTAREAALADPHYVLSAFRDTTSDTMAPKKSAGKLATPVTITSSMSPATPQPQFLSVIDPGLRGSSAIVPTLAPGTLSLGGGPTPSSSSAPASLSSVTKPVTAIVTSKTSDTSNGDDSDVSALDGFEGTAKSSNKKGLRDSCRDSCW